jgi:hypothetical protein
LVDNVTGIKKIICCSLLSQKVNDIDANAQKDQLSLTGAQLCAK